MNILNDIIDALANASIILVPILTYAVLHYRSKLRRMKRIRERELAELERRLELEVYALEFYHNSINDMIENGSNGKLLKYLIKTGQL